MSTTTTPQQTSTARRVPLPAREPPFDDERNHNPVAPVGRAAASPPVTQGSLALAHVLPGGVPAMPEPAAALHVVDLGAGGPSIPIPSRRGRDSARPNEPPDARRWSVRLAQGIAEVLSGHRPVQQLTRWTDESVYEMLTHRLTGRLPVTGPRPRVRSVRICRPRDGVLEATAVVDVSGRCRALALRLEADHGHWRCTALDIV